MADQVTEKPSAALLPGAGINYEKLWLVPESLWPELEEVLKPVDFSRLFLVPSATAAW